jgi:hypothetical protein
MLRDAEEAKLHSNTHKLRAVLFPLQQSPVYENWEEEDAGDAGDAEEAKPPLTHQ